MQNDIVNVLFLRMCEEGYNESKILGELVRPEQIHLSTFVLEKAWNRVLQRRSSHELSQSLSHSREVNVDSTH